jgi:hypothetical protein
MHAHLILAAGPDWNSGLLGVIAAMMKLVAVLVVLWAAMKGVKSVLDGKPGGAAKVVIGAAVLVSFLWNPTLINQVIDTASGLVGQGVTQVNTSTQNVPGAPGAVSSPAPR